MGGAWLAILSCTESVCEAGPHEAKEAGKAESSTCTVYDGDWADGGMGRELRKDRRKGEMRSERWGES